MDKGPFDVSPGGLFVEELDGVLRVVPIFFVQNLLQRFRVIYRRFQVVKILVFIDADQEEPVIADDGFLVRRFGPDGYPSGIFGEERREAGQNG